MSHLKNIAWIIVAAVALTGFVAAQLGNLTGTDEPARLEVRVIRASDGEPLDAARVSLRPWGCAQLASVPAELRTDGGGRCQLDAPREGYFVVVVRRDGYQDHATGPLAWTSAEPEHTVTCSLELGFDAGSWVVDAETRTPLADARVVAMPIKSLERAICERDEDFASGASIGLWSRVTRTDASGKFALDDLSDGAYEVTVSPADRPSEPLVLRVRQGLPDLPLEVPIARGQTLTGTIHNSLDIALSSVVVTARHGRGFGREVTTMTDLQGNFLISGIRLTTPELSFTLESGQGLIAHYHPSPAELRGELSVDLRLPLAQPVEVDGGIRTREGALSTGIVILCFADDRCRGVRLAPVQTSLVAGRFQCTIPSPGRYRWSVYSDMLPGSMASGLVDLSHTRLAELTVASGEMTVTVPEGLGSLPVELVRLDKTGNEILWVPASDDTKAGLDREVTFSCLSPGRYIARCDLSPCGEDRVAESTPTKVTEGNVWTTLTAR